MEVLTKVLMGVLMGVLLGLLETDGWKKSVSMAMWIFGWIFPPIVHHKVIITPLVEGFTRL